MSFYQPERTILGPAYGKGFKLFSTFMTIVLAGYALNIVARTSPAQLGLGGQAFLLALGLLLGVRYFWFLRATVTIDDAGIRQTWLFKKQVAWADVRGAQMIGIPMLSWLFPPRMIVRTATSMTSFNGGSPAVLAEFAKIAQAFQVKP